MSIDLPFVTRILLIANVSVYLIQMLVGERRRFADARGEQQQPERPRDAHDASHPSNTRATSRAVETPRCARMGRVQTPQRGG